MTRTLGEETLVHETRNDVRVLEVVVVVRTEDVRRNGRSEVAPEFFVVRAEMIESTSIDASRTA